MTQMAFRQEGSGVLEPTGLGSGLLGREADSFEIAIVELEDIRVLDVTPGVLQRIGNGVPVDSPYVRQKVHQAIGETDRVNGSHVGGHGLGYGRNPASGGSSRYRGRQEEQEHNDEHDVLSPPQYASHMLHGGTPPGATRTVLQYCDNSGNGLCACQPVTGRADPLQGVRVHGWPAVQTREKPIWSKEESKVRRSTCQYR